MMKSWQLENAPPVEHRLLGLDRRLIAPTIAVLCVVLLWSIVMPAIDESLEQDVVPPETVYDVGPVRFFEPHNPDAAIDLAAAIAATNAADSDEAETSRADLNRVRSLVSDT